MADFPTIQTPQIGLEDQLGAAANRLVIANLGPTGYWDPPDAPVPLARAPAGQFAITDGSRSGPFLRGLSDAGSSAPFTSFGLGAAGLTIARGVNTTAVPAAAVDRTTVLEAENPGGFGMGVGQEWFEKCHVFPGSLALGNVLTTQIRTLELFNAFRRPPEPVSWTAFVNNAGAGVTVTNLPGLPFAIASRASFIANVQVSTAGPPAISGTLDFTFGAPTSQTFEVPVTGNRITIFQFRPQTPVREDLLFKTDILRIQDGSEQRIKLREAPRSSYDFSVLVDGDRSRDAINAVLFDWQARVFGVPVWPEQRALGAPLVLNDTFVVVDTTAADFRIDSLVMLYDGNFSFDVLEIASFTPTDITLKSGVSQGFDAVDTLVMPVRTAYTKPQLNNSRFAIGPSEFRMQFETLDNVDLSDVGSFTTYQGVGQTVAKPVLDQLNFMSGATIGEGNKRRVIQLDPKTGPQIQISPWGKGKPLYQFGFESASLADTFAWRQLLHYLAGSQTAFYVPTGRTDFKPLVDLGSGATAIDFPNYGFTDFVQSATPRSDVRVLRKDGTQSLHQIIGSSVVSNDVERLTVSPGIVPALPIAEVDRIEILTLSRILDDKVRLTHRRPGDTRIDIKLIGIPA